MLNYIEQLDSKSGQFVFFFWKKKVKHSPLWGWGAGQEGGGQHFHVGLINTLAFFFFFKLHIRSKNAVSLQQGRKRRIKRGSGKQRGIRGCWHWSWWCQWWREAAITQTKSHVRYAYCLIAQGPNHCWRSSLTPVQSTWFRTWGFGGSEVDWYPGRKHQWSGSHGSWWVVYVYQCVTGFLLGIRLEFIDLGSSQGKKFIALSCLYVCLVWVVVFIWGVGGV